MSLFIEQEYMREFPFDVQKVAEDTVEAALDFCHCEYECQVNLLFVDHEEMQTINREQRQKDMTTDVLSFPMNEYPAPGDFSLIDQDAELGMTCFHPVTGELLLGDIVLNLDRVVEQARQFGHSQKREYAFLIAHSMLHLMGYDHMEEGERQEMEAAQQTIMEMLGISRK